MSQRAVCVRCGAVGNDFRALCPACGHRPEGDGLLLAWLLSENALSTMQLEDVARRVRAGETIKPSTRMLERAKQALYGEKDDGLTWGQRAFVLYSSLLFTAMPGMLWAWWYRNEKPRAAKQVFLLSFPAGVLATLVMLWATYLL